jgi:peptidoglycan/xylan/chitin deacetylase (PgdA/CDA1 family)
MCRTIILHRTTLLALSLLVAAAGLTPPVAHAAADCPGNPDALGTSRTIVVDPKEHPRIGTMQYGETLPLEDHEVVLTFDDGPLPAHTNAVLQTLAAQCVKATFFLVGRMAKEFPQDVRRIHDAGHTIGTHSENHPTFFGKLPPERMSTEIDDGIAHVTAALADPSQLAPFFRIPGLRRGDLLEAELSKRGLMTWSADFPADDWRHISSTQVVNYALSRLEAKGKGVLLLHDIQARTQAALPVILQQLKARGYKIVHVVPATPDRPKTPTEPTQWVPHWLHPPGAVAKAPTGFAFDAPEMPSHRASRSIRSVWLMQQKPAMRTSAAILHTPPALALHGKKLRANVITTGNIQSVARLPSGHAVRRSDQAPVAIGKPIKTGSRTDVAPGPNIR